MLKNSLGSALTWIGMSFIPLYLQADSSSQSVETEPQLIGIYNQSAMLSCEDSWDLVLTGDYIYWKWQQAGLTIGTLATPTASGSSGFFNGTEETVFQTPGYQSGFQVGLGCSFHGMDHWRFIAEYTWYKNTSNTTTTAGDHQYLAVSPTLVRHLKGSTPGILLSKNLQTQAELEFDALDTLLQRPFYFARNVVGNFSMGLKTLWISESGTGNGSQLYYIEENADAPVSVAGSFVSSSIAKSWSLGPKIGFEANWLLGYGLSVITDLSSSIVYTSNTTLSSSVKGQVSNVSSADLSMSQSKYYNILNPITETSLGVNWGAYFWNNEFHINFSASYDFNVYWSRGILGVLIGDQGSPGNMVLHGLNIQARFDF